LSEIHVTDVINKIRQKWGHHAIYTANRMSDHRDVLNTGFPTLDNLIVGIPQRGITQFVGKPTSGMTTLIYQLMAESQSQNQHIVYVDTGTTFNGGYAIRCGVSVDDVVLVEAEEESLILDLLIEIVKSQLVNLLVLNLLSLKNIKLDWRKVLPEIWASPCAIVMLTRPHIHHDWASLRLQIIHQQWVSDENDIVGCLSKVVVERHRYGNVGKSVVLNIPFKEGTTS